MCWATVLGLALLCLFAYGNSLGNGFVWDDTQQILQNPYLTPGQPWQPLITSGVWAFSRDPRIGNTYYRPLPMLLYRAIAQVAGFDAFYFHLASLAFHTFATLLAYQLFLALCRRRGLAFGAAALFAVHPIHTEAVDWASCLSELTCAVFLLLAVLFQLRAQAESADVSANLTRRSWYWLIAACVAFALALLSKETAIVLPVLIFLCAFLFDDAQMLAPAPRLKRAALFCAPYIAVAACYVIARRYALGSFYRPQRNWILSPVSFALTDIRLLSQYWLKLLLPFRLNAYYSFHIVQAAWLPRELAAILFLAAAITALVIAKGRWPLATFCVVWVFVTLAPAMALRELGRNAFAERYLYIPSIGFCMLAAWAAWEIALHLVHSKRLLAATVALLGVLALFGWQSSERNSVWHDDLTLFTQTVQQSPDAPFVQLEVGELLRNKGDNASAEQYYLRTAELAARENPPDRMQFSLAYGSLALIYGQEGRYPEALVALDEVKLANPNDPDVDGERGMVLAQSGNWRDAKAVLEKVLAAHPDDVNALFTLGTIATNNEQNYPTAIQYLQRALQLHQLADAFGADLHDNLGITYCNSKRFSECLAQLEKSVEINPNDPGHHENLGNAFALTGNFASARAEFEKALVAAPNYAPAKESLARLDAMHR